MPKVTSKYVCQQCGYESTGYLGKCPNCGSWNSLVETVQAAPSSREIYSASKTTPIKLVDVQTSSLTRLSTDLGELDRVLGGPASPDGGQGGGLVPGSVVLLAGEPGIGKSTLLLQVAANVARKGHVFYVSGEESPGQIKTRAERLGIGEADILFVNETNVEIVLATLDGSSPKPSLIIVDSIQTMYTSDLNGTAGSVGQVRESANKLLNFAKSNGIPMFLVGHVTKEGGIAGPMVLSHLVDTVLFFEGERYQSLRVLRGIKNRFGPTDELGVFSMEEKGLVGVDNPSAIFLTERKENVPGSVVTCVMEGSRPLLVEIQALVVPSNLPIPRRSTTGIDFNRLALLSAVLTRRLNYPLGTFDIFVNVAGGIKINEPAADLAICLAIASAFRDIPVEAKTCLIGEVGLLGEVRPVGQVKRREQEAKRLGFTKVITPENTPSLLEAVVKLLKKARS
ncbi:MAG: DNA repair protein RadA [bacterium]|nr:DNA repair protein RadA [bacterium]